MDHGGHKAPIDIRAEEETGPTSFLQSLDGDCRGDQCGHIHLEELVPGIGFEDPHQVLAAVRPWWKAHLGHDRIDLLAQNGHRTHRAGVGAGGEETDEALFSGDVTRGIEALDPDVVEVGRTVHAGSGVRLRDHQSAAFAGQLSADLGQVLERMSVLRRPQQAKSAPLADRQDVLLPRPFQVVLPVAQEGEVVTLEPAQQFLGLGEIPDFLGMGHCAEPVGDERGLCAHRLPVLHRGTHVAKDTCEAVDQLRPRLVAGAVDFDRDPGLKVGGVVIAAQQVRDVGHRGGVPARDAEARRHPSHTDELVGRPVTRHHQKGVHHQVNGRVLAHEFGVDRVNQEGHVIRDDVDDAAVRFVADVDLRDLGHPATGYMPVSDRASAEHLEVVVLGVFTCEVLVVVGNESLERAAHWQQFGWGGFIRHR